jgi:hypothetical protein
MDIVLHIGAHRTATTTLQVVCEQNAAQLRAEGIAIWTPRNLRCMAPFRDAPETHLRAGRMRLPKLFQEPAGWLQQPDAGRWGGEAARWAEARAAVADAIGRLAGRGARTLLMSEENMPGRLRDNLTRRRFYPDAALRLQAYAALLPAPPVRIGLGLRDYATYWVSAYLFAARRRRLPDFATIAAALAAATGWARLVQTCRETFPDAEICLWRYESAGSRPCEVVDALLGRPAAARRLNAGDWWLNAAPPIEGTASGLMRLFQPASPVLFPDEVAARLSAVYAAECEDLRRGLHGARLLFEADAP